MNTKTLWSKGDANANISLGKASTIVSLLEKVAPLLVCFEDANTDISLLERLTPTSAFHRPCINGNITSPPWIRLIHLTHWRSNLPRFFSRPL